MQYIKCINCGKKAAWVTLWGNAILVALKISAGIFGKSQALVADGIHSSADVVIALVTLVALAISGKGSDKDHPYGHGKIEFISASMVTLALLTACFFLFKGAIHQLRHGVATSPSFITFLAALISIAINEMMFRINRCAGKALKSPALVANAWHNRYDAYTSIVVAAGILGALAGFRYFDPIAAMFVGIIIFKISFEIFHEAYEGLMDTALPPEVVEEVHKVLGKIHAVENIEKVSGRRMGQKLWMDVAVKIPDRLNVAKAHEISAGIQEAILLHVENIEDVHVETIAAPAKTNPAPLKPVPAPANPRRPHTASNRQGQKENTSTYSNKTAAKPKRRKRQTSNLKRRQNKTQIKKEANDGTSTN